MSWLESARTGFPGWCEIWGRGADLETLAETAVCGALLLDETLGAGLRSEILKYEVLRLHGGVQVDWDFQLFRLLDEIMLEGCLHVGCQRARMASNALIASPAGFTPRERAL
ncbi:hypothetical protein HQ447_03060 [bacterium]|nr:hypothetical protein [bacterium]